MIRGSNKNVFAKYLQGTTALVALSLAAFPAVSFAQDAAPADPAASEGEAVVIVGTRASQRSSIDRKKRAATATDSIVAEDVGAFPDKNIGEAISRIAGVALDRGDFGEGTGVSIRGNGPDLTRVELDGLGVQNTGGGNRGNEFRDLSSDLIKSVDVIKGSTPDLTEGSLGGTVKIQTRTGLDFKKPFFSMRFGVRGMSLSDKLTPDINIIASRKFLDDRLGVIFNATIADVETQGHLARVSNNQATYYRPWDYDNSPEKTFQFNPATVDQGDKTIYDRVAGWTAYDIVNRAAGATSKAQCETLFPLLTQTQMNAVPTAGDQRLLANTERNNARLTCLNQWNDYVPSLPRYSYWRRFDNRRSYDLRFDYRVNDDLTVFAKANYNNKYIQYQDHNFSLGTPNLPAVTHSATVPGYTITNTNNIIASAVDASHHVTSFTMDNTANIGMDSRDFYQDITTTYLSTGATYRKNGLLVEFLAGRAISDFVMEQNGVGWGGFVTGGLKGNITPGGLWSYTLPAGVDQTNPALYVVLNPAVASGAVNPGANTPKQPAVPAYTAAQSPRYTNVFSYQYTPQITENTEDTVKLDVTYDFQDVPFIRRVKSGLNLRKYDYSGWGGGGLTISPASGTFGTSNFVAPVVVPRTLVRATFRGCEPTATSTVPCPYGVNPNYNLSTPNDTVVTMTQAKLYEMMSASMKPIETSFFEGFADRGDLLSSWYTIDTLKALSYLDTSNFNLGCVKVCKGSDGNMYDQPVTAINEETQAGYFMVEFEQELPFGMLFQGNAGTRYVKNTNLGTGVMTIQNTTKNSGWSLTNVNDVTTTSKTMNVQIQSQTEDWLPAYNVALWLLRDQLVLRGYAGRVIARPPVTQMLPAGTCVFDERREGGTDSDGSEQDMTCTGRVGNPGLLPFRAMNHNTSLEWYPTKDIMVSLGWYRNLVRTGAPINFTLTNVDLFGDGQQFTVPTYVNGPAGPQHGLEFATKTALTFLPWRFKYTGFDFNYAKARANSLAIVDPNSGDPQPPQFQSSYFMNLSLWYDDGTTNARVAYQKRDYFFDTIAFGGGGAGTPTNNYPGTGYGNIRTPFNPGAPYFRDPTEYVDAKISHYFTPQIQVYIEGRNLLAKGASRSQREYNQFTDGTPSILELSYPGRQFFMGINFKMK